MALPFFTHYAAGRTLGGEPPAPELEADQVPQDPSDPSEPEDAQVQLALEREPERWTPLDLALPPGFTQAAFPRRPRRFVDGKDVGLVVAALRAPHGYLVPVRLSQIGAVVLSEEDGVLHRSAEIVEKAVSFITHPFPWHEIEALTAALQERGLRLLPVRLPQVADPSEYFGYGLLRKVTFNRSNSEMKQMEEGLAALFYDDVPTVIDGRLQPRLGGRSQGSAVIGVIKTHQRSYLHPAGLRALHGLRPLQRTPLFGIEGAFPVVSFYLRLAPGLPDHGIVRVEVPRGYYQDLPQQEQRPFIDQMAATLYHYRCKQRDYGRAAVSLHPIVRAEESLAALLCPLTRLTTEFYRMAGL